MPYLAISIFRNPLLKILDLPLIIFTKQLTNKYAETFGIYRLIFCQYSQQRKFIDDEFFLIFARVGTIAHQQKVLKQVGVVHDIKSQ